MSSNPYVTAIRNAGLVRRIGRVTQFFGLMVEANGPDVFLGEVCAIYSRSQLAPVNAEVVGIRDGMVLLMPHGDLKGIALGSEVIASGHPLQVAVGDALLGRVVDALGRPLDGKPLPSLPVRMRLRADPINPLARRKIDQVLETGVKAIDSFLTLAKGQRIGIFSGSGVGKSTLLGMLARNVRTDVNVIALVGERGREVPEFIERSLGPEGLKRSVVVVSTSDQPAMLRSNAAFTATAIAEYFRDQKRDVLLIMDSVSRFAMAHREIGLATGEPPTARGYTPSVFANMPKLLERCGAVESGGSITAMYTVLAEGDDFNDPIADALRSILDGHIVLSRDLANQRHFPSIDILKSISRLMPNVVPSQHLNLAQRGVACLSLLQKNRDLIDIGAYKAGSNPQLDRAIALAPHFEEFLQQAVDATVTRADAIGRLGQMLGEA